MHSTACAAKTQGTAQVGGRESFVCPVVFYTRFKWRLVRCKLQYSTVDLQYLSFSGLTPFLADSELNPRRCLCVSTILGNPPEQGRYAKKRAARNRRACPGVANSDNGPVTLSSRPCFVEAASNVVHERSSHYHNGPKSLRHFAPPGG